MSEIGASLHGRVCDECRCYVKLLQQNGDPIVDEVVSLGFDLRVRESGYRRGAFNPILVGH